MTFTEEILERAKLVQRDKIRLTLVDSLIKTSLCFFIKEEEIEERTDFEVAFLSLIDEKYSEKVFTRKRFEEVVEYAKDFYQSSRILPHHIIEHGLFFPSEEEDRWSLVYEVQGGDLIIYSKFKGFEHEGLAGSH